MFCSDISYKNVSSSLFPDVIDPCVVEFINGVCCSVYIYVFVLFLICLRWSPNEACSSSQKRFFIGHNIRNCLLILLIFLHIIEFIEHLLTDVKIWYIKFIPLIASLSVIICQVFYNRIEEFGKYHYLSVPLMYWVSCGICRNLEFLLNYSLNLDLQYVRYTISVKISLSCYCLILCDCIALMREVQHVNSCSSNSSTSEDKYLYKHEFCNWYSKITFYWLTPVLHLGYVSSIGLGRTAQLPLSESSSFQFDKLKQTYFKYTKVNLWGNFVNLYWKKFITGGFLKLLGDLTGLILPLGISVVVSYIETRQSHTLSLVKSAEVNFIKWQEFLNNGYVMAVIVFLASLAQGTLSQNSTHIINVEGIRLKNALHGLIYHKLLRIRRHFSADMCNSDTGNIGYIANLMTEDSYNIMSCFWIGNYIWAIPLKITLLIFLLYKEIGISAVIGSIICIILMLILQFVVGVQMSRNHKLITEWSDRRLRRINEALQGIRFIKLCSWEMDFIEEISNLRKNEVKHLNLDSIYWTNITFLANTSSIIIAVVTLTLHYFIENKRLTLSALFASLALFNQLTVPLFIFPIMVPIIISAVVSVKRIETFLSLPEIEIPAQEMKAKEKQNSRTQTNFIQKSSDSLKKTDRTEDYGIRLRKITENSDIENDFKTKNNENNILKLENAVCSWNLQNVALEIESISICTGTLNLIIGEKGSGKTSLLSAILGEMACTSGKIEWSKHLRIGYVPETAWLLNDTVKMNITFGHPFQEKHFFRVIQLCALRPDINTMPNRELTVVGDRGHALSGGQKQRLMLARMLYSRPDVILMDDPFCALDSKTTNYIFENTIKKFLAKQNKTVIMVTSCKKFLAEADQIIVMENLKVKTSGSYADIGKVALREIQNLQEGIEDRSKCRRSIREELDTFSHRSLKSSVFVPLKRCRSALSGSRYFTHDLLLPTDDCDVGPTTLGHKQRRSRAATVTEYPQSSVHQVVFRMSSLQTNPSQCHSKKKYKRFDFEDELISKRHQSTVSDHFDDFDEIIEPLTDIFSDMSSVWDIKRSTGEQCKNDFKIYMSYIKQCNLLTVSVYFVLTFGWQVVRIVTEYWLSSIVSAFNATSSEELDIRWYLYSYVILTVIALLLSLSSTITGQYAGSVARELIHRKILNNVMKCPVQFFDTISFGQIINRFSTDIEIIDKKIPTSTQRLIQFQLLCLSAILLNCLITPWFVMLIIPIALVYYKIQMFYRRSSKELQHLENLLKTPVTNHFSETFNGLEVIRALEQQNTFLKMLFHRIDAHTNIFLISNATNRWLGIMLDYLGGIIVFAAMIVSLITVSLEPTFKTSTYFGLAINYTLLVPIYLTWVVKFLIDLDIYMGAVERVQSFSKLSNEDYNLEAPIPENWPSKGAVQFTNVMLRYTDEGPAVIQNFNLQIEPKQKVGICGRTGSGKSSLMMSLFRMIPCMEGTIRLDGVDICTVPLQCLRSKISIVPQDVILFSGNIRQNLDLRHEFTDEKLWNALKLVRMDESIAKIGGLGAAVQDGGSNLSAGEKQLICLARATLRDSCCLILDEATNALQPEAEIEFLNMVLKIFVNSTVIVVTHRATSMLDFDRILVLDNGTIVEDGSARELIALPNSKFFNLIKTSQELSGEKPRFYF